MASGHSAAIASCITPAASTSLTCSGPCHPVIAGFDGMPTTQRVISTMIPVDKVPPSLRTVLKRNELSLERGEATLVLHPEDIADLQNQCHGSVNSESLEYIEKILGRLKSLQISKKDKECHSILPRSLHIAQFSHLAHLHLVRVSPTLLADIACLRPQLKRVTCYQSISSLEDLLRSPDDTFGISSIWSELHFLILSFNTIQHLDQNLDLLPNLEHFDVSHNQLSSPNGIQSLKNVQLLNMSHNRLKSFPVFGHNAFNSLRSLSLHYNYICDLTGLQCLKQLELLDLSHNYLTNHSALEPMVELENLAELMLDGNPLSFHVDHRILTIKRINRISKQRGLVLDGRRIDQKEIELVREVNVQRFLDVLTDQDSDSTLDGSFGGVNGESMSSPQDGSNEKASRKSGVRTRRPVIQERPENDVEWSGERVVGLEDALPTAGHIETKKLLEQNRKELGSGWLISSAGILGNSSSQVASTPKQSLHSETESSKLHSTKLSENEVRIESHEATLPKVIVSGTSEETTTLLTSSATESERIGPDETSWFDRSNLGSQEESRPVPFDDLEQEKQTTEYVEDDPETSLFIVRVDGSDDDLFLSIGSESLTERDGLSAKPLRRVPLDSLLSTKIDPKDEEYNVLLTFKISTREKSDTTYKMESLEAAEDLLSLLIPHVEAKILKTVEDGALQCMKCSSQFSKDVAKLTVVKSFKMTDNRHKSGDLEEVDMCPNCGSTMLIEAPISLPSLDKLDSVELSTSATSSIRIQDFFRSGGGSIKSNEESQSPKTRPRSVSSEVQLQQRKAVSLSPTRDKELSDSSSSSVDCISLGQENDQVVTFPVADSLVRKSESDVTILSNPSQSSIAVISSVPSSDLGPSPLGVIMEHEQMCHVHSFNVFDVPMSPVSQETTIVRVASPMSETWYDSRSANTLQDSPIHAPASVPDDDIVVEASSTQLWAQLEEPEQNSDFAQLDHRVRLYLDVEVFKEDEELLVAVKGSAVSFNPTREFPLLLVISSQNIYLFDTGKGTEEDISSYLREYISIPSRNLSEIHTQLGSQGLVLTFGFDTIHLILLRDADLCNSLVARLKDIYSRQVFFSLSVEDSLNNLKREALVSELLESQTVQVKHFLMLFWRQDFGELEPVALIVTKDSLYIVQTHYEIHKKKFEMHFSLLERQSISNLTMMHVTCDLQCCSFHFLDEDTNRESFWALKASCRSALSSLLGLLRLPWEDTFAIELQLAVLDDCFCKLESTACPIKFN